MRYELDQETKEISDTKYFIRMVYPTKTVYDFHGYFNFTVDDQQIDQLFKEEGNTGIATFRGNMITQRNETTMVPYILNIPVTGEKQSFKFRLLPETDSTDVAFFLDSFQVPKDTY